MKATTALPAEISILVPVGPFHELDCLPGSGIVTTRLDGDPDTFVPIYYAGRVGGEENLHSLDERVRVAATRCLFEADTLGMQWMHRGDANAMFAIVGIYDVNERKIVLRDPQAYRDWERCHPMVLPARIV